MRTNRRWIAVAATVIGASLLGAWWHFREPASELLQKSELALARKQFGLAEQLALRLVEHSDHDRREEVNSALLIASHAAKGQGDIDRAIAYLDRIPDDGSREAVQARRETGRILLLDKKRLTLAYEQFGRCLAQDPDEILALDGMAYVLGVSGEYRELVPYRLKVIAGDHFATQTLHVLAMGHRLLADVQESPPFIATTPDGILELICQADLRLFSNDFRSAIDFAKRAAAKSPDRPKPHLTVLLALLQSDQLTAFQSYHGTMGATFDDHSELWRLRAEYCRRCDRSPEAARCYWESLRRDPNQQTSNYQLAQILVTLGDRERAVPFTRRSDLLREYMAASLASLSAGEHMPQTLQEPAKAARLAEQLGLIWEAYGWYSIAGGLNPNNADLAAKAAALKPALANLSWQRSEPNFNPALEIDLTAYPVPDLTKIAPPQSLETISLESGRVHFEELSAERGIAFSFHSGRDPLTQGMLETFEFTGGGVGVLDFDLDRWPDLYFTQGADWPVDPRQTVHVDALYRNAGGDVFIDVAEQARIVENRYSQGVAVGDFNSDGFPDLYIANIGENTLYENNGDGTFVKVGAASGLDDRRWTSSCLIADLNGDALPDIYDVNYLTDPDLFTRVCRTNDGGRYACPPQVFSPDVDQVFLNRGDGTFENVSSSSGIDHVQGRGLGIIAVDIDRSGQLDLYIANDVGPNFFFWNHTNRDTGAGLVFAEQAMLMGLALNGNGQAESGMGLACGDIDGDLRLDLFVTNFFEESNTLYRQQDSDLFLDATNDAHLRDSSLSMLGFGTQFFDPDLDGDLDIVIANGHITDLRESRGRPLQMRPQFYRNDGHGRFIEAKTGSIGPYFERELLGRGLARVDWNRDGRTDFAVTHLDAPVSLVTNVSTEHGNYVALRFIGIRSARDAIGTSVTLVAGGKGQHHQLTAGDGYQASNERVLTIGLADADAVESLELKWPSGEMQTFHSLSANAEYIFLEGRDESIACPRQPSGTISVDAPVTK